MEIALLGYGTVGSGVYEALQKNSTYIERKIGTKISVTKILSNHYSDEVAHLTVTNINDIVDDEQIQIVCEMLGGIDIAYQYSKQLLETGKHVITSNKAVVAAHGAELLKIAREHNCCYLFEASVGGGIPIIHGLTESLIGDQITSVQGILNGTTNFILSEMKEKHAEFATVLKQAQELGYAEKDPTDDVEGVDVARKIAIISSLITGVEVSYDQFTPKGIKQVTLRDFEKAQELNCNIRLIATANFSNGTLVSGSVLPTFVKRSHPLANVNDVFNAVLVSGNIVDDIMFYGRGAGKFPTASAVINDIITCIVDKEVMQRIHWSTSDNKSLNNTNFYKQMYYDVDSLDDSLLEEIKAIDNQVEVVEANREALCFITSTDLDKNQLEQINTLLSQTKFISYPII